MVQTIRTVLTMSPCIHSFHIWFLCQLCIVQKPSCISFFYTPCLDTAISSRGGISLSYPPPLLRLLSYPTKLLFNDNNNKKVQLNKLPQTTIIFRIIDGTIRLNNAKIQTHALGSICDGI